MPPREEEEGATTRATTTSSRGRRDDFEEEDDLDFDRTLALGKIFFFFFALSFGKTDSDFCRSLSLKTQDLRDGYSYTTSA